MSKVIHDSEKPSQGQQVITACAFIHQKFDGVEKIFLAKRALKKKFLPGVYEMPGGHIEFGEDLIEGLKREIREELGMDVSVGDPFDVFAYHNKIRGSHSIQVGYFAQFVSPIENISIHPEDHSGYKWFAESELDEVLAANRNEDDYEVKMVRKGFSLLRDESLKFK